jgi:hypothetical protein
MAKVMHKPAAEPPTPPDLVLVEKPKPPTAAKPEAEPAAPARDTGVPRNTTSNVWRDLHPARVWPD